MGIVNVNLDTKGCENIISALQNSTPSQGQEASCEKIVSMLKEALYLEGEKARLTKQVKAEAVLKKITLRSRAQHIIRVSLRSNIEYVALVLASTEDDNHLLSDKERGKILDYISNYFSHFFDIILKPPRKLDEQ